MAKIIRTTPKSRRGICLRVAISFLLFLQIQMPDAKEIKTEKLPDLSFRLAAQATPQISLNKEATEQCCRLQAAGVN